MATYEIYMASAQGKLIDAISDWGYLTYAAAVNSPTRLSLITPYTRELWNSLIRDTRLYVYRNGNLVTETCWFVRSFSRQTEADRREFIHIQADRANVLLSQRIVEFPSGSSRAEGHRAADNIMHSIVSDNLGYFAREGRSLSPYFVVSSSSSSGAECSKAFSKENVQDILLELADISSAQGTRIFFDVVVSGDVLQFNTYVGQRGTDRTGETVVGGDYGNLDNPVLTYDYSDTCSTAYVGGQNSGTDRILISITNDTISGLTPFSRVERFYDGRNTSKVSELISKGFSALEDNRPKIKFRGDIQDTETSEYGIDWEWGDKVRVSHYGLSFDAYVNSINVTVDPRGETIKASIVGEEL